MVDSLENRVLWRAIAPTPNPESMRVYNRQKSGSVQIAKSASIINDAAIVHTVTAGKTFYLCAVTSTIDNKSGGNSWGGIRLRNVGDTYQFDFIIFQGDDPYANTDSLTFNPPMEIIAGWDVYIQSGGAGVMIYGFCYGYEL